MASSEEALQALRQRRVVRIRDLDKINRYQIDELDLHEDLDNTEDGAPPAKANDVKMRVHPAPAREIPQAEQPGAADEEYTSGTHMNDGMDMEDALQDPPQEIPPPEQSEAEKDLPPAPEDFESAAEKEMEDRHPQQDQPASTAAAAPQAPQQPETFAQRRQRMDLHETDFLRHPGFKQKHDDQQQATNPKR